jgi:hypothetical protein
MVNGDATVIPVRFIFKSLTQVKAARRHPCIMAACLDEKSKIETPRKKEYTP